MYHKFARKCDYDFIYLKINLWIFIFHFHNCLPKSVILLKFRTVKCLVRKIYVDPKCRQQVLQNCFGIEFWCDEVHESRFSYLYYYCTRKSSTNILSQDYDLYLYYKSSLDKQYFTGISFPRKFIADLVESFVQLSQKII